MDNGCETYGHSPKGIPERNPRKESCPSPPLHPAHGLPRSPGTDSKLIDVPESTEAAPQRPKSGQIRGPVRRPRECDIAQISPNRLDRTYSAQVCHFWQQMYKEARIFFLLEVAACVRHGKYFGPRGSTRSRAKLCLCRKRK